MREMAYLEIIEKLEKSGKIHVAILSPIFTYYFLQYLHDTITSSFGA